MAVETQYSIISRGTEKYSNKGYMGITYPKRGYRYIQDIDHGVLFSEVTSHSLKIKDEYDICNIVVSRFELMAELFFSRVMVSDKILVCGYGNVGYAAINSLRHHGYKDITVLVKNSSKYKKTYNEVKFTSKISSNYNTYIDATGSSEVIKEIIEKCPCKSEVVILSTPRDGEFLVNPLIINRKNLMIYGAHELNGYSRQYRNLLLNKILERNKNKSFDSVVSINSYSKDNLKKIMNKKKKIYDIFKY